MTRATGTPAARGDNSPLTSRIDENHPGALADLAERTARLAGDMLSSRRSAVLADPSNITAKGSATDLVTALDRESEALIRNQIAAERPSHRFIGEESAGVETVSSGADDELTWIVRSTLQRRDHRVLQSHLARIDHPGYRIQLLARATG